MTSRSASVLPSDIRPSAPKSLIIEFVLRNHRITFKDCSMRNVQLRTDLATIVASLREQETLARSLRASHEVSEVRTAQMEAERDRARRARASTPSTASHPTTSREPVDLFYEDFASAQSCVIEAHACRNMAVMFPTK